MESLYFTHNWNQKLYCRSFSTVRIENPVKYRLNEEYRVYLKQTGSRPPIDMGIAILKDISYFYLFDVTPAIALIDTNLSREDFIKLVLTMYKNAGIDFNIKRMSLLIFQYLQIKEVDRSAATARTPSQAQ